MDACRRAVRGGATAVQVRLKGAPPADILALARALVGALAVPVLVNDRVDLALAAGAAGAHLGHDDVPLAALRPHVPAGFLLGISVGSSAEAARARSWPADYWSVGPCFATAHKPDAGPLRIHTCTLSLESSIDVDDGTSSPVGGQAMAVSGERFGRRVEGLGKVNRKGWKKSREAAAIAASRRELRP